MKRWSKTFGNNLIDQEGLKNINPKLKAKILESLGSHFNTVELLWERKN